MMIAILKLTNCLDCPQHEIKSSSFTGDSFDMIDEDVFCKAKKRFVTQSNRPWETRKESAVPVWCPLLPVKKRPRKLSVKKVGKKR